MLRAERQAKILQVIRERGYVENEVLAQLFGVTQATIRRDLKSLNEQNLVKLDHGGSYAFDLTENSTEPLYETKVYVNMAHKQAIGAAAVKLVKDGDTIILDSGTTNAQIAHYLKRSKLKKLTVITCDLIIAKELCTAPNISVVILGGIVRHSFYSVSGPYAEYILKNLRANKTFLGIDAVSIENGVSNIILAEVPIKQLMIQIADQTIMVADSSKFGRC